MKEGLLDVFIAGALAMGYFAAGLFFVRYWRRSGDRLFGIFGAAFWLLALQRVMLGLVAETAVEFGTWYYVLRLIAFLLILVAIVDKNRR